jgi:hypothetical protein
MIVFHFDCDCELGGHGSYKSESEAEKFRTLVAADGCHPGEVEATDIGNGGSFGDIEEHFNVQFGQPVRGRRQWRALQEKFNTSDFDSNKAHERQSATWKTRWAEPSKVITRDLPETEGPPLLLEEPVSIDPTRGE